MFINNMSIKYRMAFYTINLAKLNLVRFLVYYTLYTKKEELTNTAS